MDYPTDMKVIRNPQLENLTHSAGEHSLDNLIKIVRRAKKLGMSVHWALSSRSTVPNKYPFADKMRAGVWQFKKGKIKMVSAALEKRSYAAPIPAYILVDGDVPTPPGWKCSARRGSSTEFRIS
jgi:hypothetical protein